MQKRFWSSSGRRQALGSAVLVAILVVLFLPGLTGEMIPSFRDNLADHLGWRLRAVSQLQHGHVPFVDPTIDAGIPMLADPNTMVLYPTTWLFAVLPPPVALTLHDLLHLFLLALGAYLLLRRMGHARRPSLAGASFAAGAGIALSQLAFTNSIATLAWMPWLIRTAFRLPEDAVLLRRRVASAAVFGALAFYAGEPVIAAMGWLAWILALIFEPGHPAWKRRLPLLAAPLLAGVLAAPLLIPFASIYPESHRAVGGLPPGSIGADAFRPARWPELLLPHLYGQPGTFAPDGFWAAPSFPWIRYEVNLHVGSIALVLILLGAWGRKTRWWTVLLLAATLLAAVPGVLAALARLIPPLASFRYAIKLLILAFLATIPLLARGVVATRRRPHAFRRLSAAIGSVTLLLAIPLLTQGSARSTLSALFPASTVNLEAPGVASSIARSVRTDAAVQLLPLAVAAAAPEILLIPSLVTQLVLEGRSMFIWDDWRRYAAPSTVMTALDGARTSEQIVTPVGRLQPKPAAGVSSPVAQSRLEFAQAWRFYGTPYGVHYRGCLGPDGLEPWRSADAALRLAGTRAEAAAHAARHLGIDAILRSHPLPSSPDIAASKSIPAAGASVILMRLTSPTPAAWMAAREIVVPSRLAAWRQLEDPASVPGADAVTLGPRSGTVRYGPGSVRLLGRTASRWRLQTGGRGPTLLVLDQAFSRRWRIRIDGRPADAVPVNLCRIGIRLPAGPHTVTVTWSRLPFLVGLGSAGAGVIILALLWCLPRKRSARHSPTGDAEPRPPATPPEK